MTDSTDGSETTVDDPTGTTADDADGRPTDTDTTSDDGADERRGDDAGETVDDETDGSTTDDAEGTATGDTSSARIETVDVEAAFASFDERWAPRVAARLNGQTVKLARLDGEFVWHSHPDADELFWVIEGGPLRIAFRDRPDAVLDPGQLAVVPAGVEHRPVADREAKVALFEPAATANTGDAGGDRTRAAVALSEDPDGRTES